MLKNKLKIMALIIAMAVAILIPVVRAENEISEDAQANKQTNTTVDTTNNDEANSTEQTETSTEQKSADESFKKGDVYLVGDEITVDYVVDGNLFVIANTVTINSQIGGDVFVMAKNVHIGKQGYIFSNLFTLSQYLNIEGVVYDVYSASETAHVDGYVYRDLRSVSSNLRIAGAIGRNAFVAFQKIAFGKTETLENGEEAVTSQALISGNFEYSAQNEETIPEGVVKGEIKYNPPKVVEVSTSVVVAEYIKDKLMELGKFVATAGIIWAILVLIAPKLIEQAVELITKKTLPTIGIGLLTPIAGVFSIIVLLVIGLTSKIALIELFLLITLLMIAKSIFAITINKIVCDKLKIEKNIACFGILVLVCMALWLITLIPYVGGIVGFATSVCGLGIIVNTFIKAIDKKTNKKENNE